MRDKILYSQQIFTVSLRKGLLAAVKGLIKSH